MIQKGHFLSIFPADCLHPVRGLSGVVGITVGLIPHQGVIHRIAASILQLQGQNH